VPRQYCEAAGRSVVTRDRYVRGGESGSASSDRFGLPFRSDLTYASNSAVAQRGAAKLQIRKAILSEGCTQPPPSDRRLTPAKDIARND